MICIKPFYFQSEHLYICIQQVLFLDNVPVVNLLNVWKGTTPYSACENRYDSTMQLLLKKDVIVNICDKNGNGLISLAYEKGHCNIEHVYLENGADV